MSAPSQLDRIEAKLDALISALAEEPDQDPPAASLDGDPGYGDRDQGQSL